jgi:hypothetical protein
MEGRPTKKVRKAVSQWLDVKGGRVRVLKVIGDLVLLEIDEVEPVTPLPGESCPTENHKG